MDSVFADHRSLNFIKVMPRDPGCLFIFWEIGEAEDDLALRLPGLVPGANQWVLRVSCLKTNVVMEINVDKNAGNWYLKCLPDTEYLAELGIRPVRGGFASVVNSGPVCTPPVGISRVIDPCWPVSDEHFRRLVPLDQLPLLTSSSGLCAKKAEHGPQWEELSWPLSCCCPENDVQRRP